MPTYEYRCPNGHVFELYQGFHDPPSEKCEVCGAGPVTKVLYPVAVHFKGSGFYSTDYGRSRKKEAASPDGGPPSETKEKKEPEKPKKPKPKPAEA